MATINFREKLYFGAHQLLAASSLGRQYEKVRLEDERSDHIETARASLGKILRHSLEKVPFYRQSVLLMGNASFNDPEALLSNFPVLTKETIRQNFELLKSEDLNERKWVYNTSGGSTGEPLRLIQDRYFNDRQMAIQWLSMNMAGRHLGQPAIHLWGSERDILYHSEKLDRRLLLQITNDRYLNSFMMSPEKMRDYIEVMNVSSPRLIVAYAQSMFDLAQFADKEQLKVIPQRAIMTSAQTLYPSMREKIESVFQSRIFNRYGSREVGDIACQCTSLKGMHIFPLGNYVEVVDDQGQPVPDGTEGNILVTNLNNYAMPLIRYSIGDRGILSPSRQCACGWHGVILQEVVGRTTDSFKKVDGTLVYGGYFAHLLFYKDWVRRFQIVQTNYDRLVYRIQKSDAGYHPSEQELAEIIDKSRIVMGPDCIIDFEFPAEILPSSSGKFRYTFSEIV